MSAEAIGDDAVASADRVERGYETFINAARSVRLKNQLESESARKPHSSSSN